MRTSRELYAKNIADDDWPAATDRAVAGAGETAVGAKRARRDGGV